MASEKTLQACREALERIQNFDPTSLGREDDLGRQLSFVGAVEPARALIGIYRRIPLSALDDFSDSQLSAIQEQANADFNLFRQMLDFSASSNNASSTRDHLMNQVKARRDQAFDRLWQFIAYGVARSTDSSLLEAQARATIQGIEDQAAQLTDQLQASKDEADTALAAIRQVASEQGVSQQAIYFKDEAQAQETLAQQWLARAYQFAAALGVFAVLSLFLHKIEWLQPRSASEALQLLTSKVLIFTVLAYLLILAARNFTTHKHNAVVNRHRQHALLTYQTLVAAAANVGTQDIVLAHAASCIFSPQETGFSQGKADTTGGSRAVLELFTKGATRSSE